jgi:hypothetical protein
MDTRTDGYASIRTAGELSQDAEVRFRWLS